MMPLSAIPPMMPPHGIVPRSEIAPPGVDSPAAPGKIAGLAPAQPSSESFGSLLGRMVEDVNASQHAATDAMHSLQSGGNVSLHQAVIAMEEANVSFQLMVQVRNKLLDAYQEIMRMSV